MTSKSDKKCVKKTNQLVYKDQAGKKTTRKGPCSDRGKSKFQIRKNFLPQKCR